MPDIVDMRDMAVSKAKTLLAIKWEATSQINEHINKQENRRVKSALQRIKISHVVMKATGWFPSMYRYVSEFPLGK